MTVANKKYLNTKLDTKARTKKQFKTKLLSRTNNQSKTKLLSRTNKQSKTKPLFGTKKQSKNKKNKSNVSVGTDIDLQQVIRANKIRQQYVDNHAKPGYKAGHEFIPTHKKLNIYAKNLRWYRESFTEFGPILHRLTENLPRDIWIKVSKEPVSSHYLEHIHDKFTQYINNKRKLGKPLYNYIKPRGSWYSRGEWLFHDVCCHLDNHISLMRVNPDARIFSVTNKKYDGNNKPTFSTKPLVGSNYMKNWKRLKTEYMVSSDDPRCQTDIDIDAKNIASTARTKITRKCTKITDKTKCDDDKDCAWMKELDTYKWITMVEDGYHGFMLDPYPSSKQLDRIDSTSLELFDVSSLVIWHPNAMAEYSNLGTIKDILSHHGNTKCKTGNNTNDDVMYMVDCMNVLIDAILDKAKNLTRIG